MTDHDDYLEIHTDDPRVDALAEEFVALKPIWDNSSNPDYVRSVEILKTLDDMKLSPWQNNQVSYFIRLSWATATNKALTLGLIANRPDGSRVSQQISGLCLVQSRMNAEPLSPA